MSEENNTTKELDYLWIKIGINDIIISQLNQIEGNFIEDLWKSSLFRIFSWEILFELVNN